MTPFQKASYWTISFQSLVLILSGCLTLNAIDGGEHFSKGSKKFLTREIKYNNG
jgi:hypothetical protein